MTACGFTPEAIDEMTLFDVEALFAYWRDFPPAHEILKYAYRIERKADAPTLDAADPSGIGALIARFPDGKVKAR
ncbi:MAG TPA: hypothetical protein VL492_05410 [Methylovirgula sp.]|jgi:hypothetical protein|nr:hypothetical protein [Methylovirgula sp.]